MAKRKKRNAVTLLSLLIVLAAFIGLYVWYSGRTAVTKDVAEDTEKTTMATVDTSKVTAIHFICKDTDLNFKLEDGVWKSAAEPDRPIDQDDVDSILKEMSNLQADQTLVKNTDNLAEYGLDDPYNYVQVTLEDGSNVSLSIGDELISSDGYYAMVNDDPTVYVVAISYALDYQDINFTDIEKAPTITATDITDISVDKRDGDDLELKNGNGETMDNSGSMMYTWRILKPYGENYGADSDKVADIQPNYTKFDYLSCVDYKGNDFGSYGLDNPLATIDIKYLEPAPSPTVEASGDDTSTEDTTQTEMEYKIFIGNQNDDGNYYVRVDGSNMVYTLDKSTVETMLTVDVFSLLDPYLNIPNIETVDKVTADIAGKEYTMEISRTTSKDENDKETTTASYSYNGSKVEEEDFKNVYKTMIMPQYDAELTKDVDIAALKPVMTLNFHIFGDSESTLTTNFLPYDDSFYIVDKGSGKYFLVDKRTIDDMATAVSTFKPAE
jgi:hypothetical protein